MLSRIGHQSTEPLHCVRETRYDRNEEEDMKTAIGLLYSFKKDLDKLHPNCVGFIEAVIQATRHF